MEMRYNLYTVVHKGLRFALQRLVYAAGRLDVHNLAERDHFFTEFKQLAVVLHQHALDEDIHFQPLIDQFAPEVGKELEEQHNRSEALLVRMEEAVAKMDEMESLANEDYKTWLTFVDDLNRFTGDYFLHLHHEECVSMPCLWNEMDDTELLAVSNKLRSEIPPHIMSIFLQYMIPAMNAEERFMMMNSAKQFAPAEAFDGICQIAKGALSPAEWDDLQAKLG